MGKEYPGNYKPEEEKAKETRPKLEKVVKNDTGVKKETVGKKMADVFLADNARNVGSYFLYDILVPAIKDLIVDGVTSSVNMIVRGSATRRSSGGYSSGRESYSSYYRGGTSERIERREPTKPPKNRYGFREITYKTREDAKDVLYSMQDIVDRYKMVKVADYYELSGRDDLETYVDHDWGWYDVDGVDIMRGTDGYVLNLPRPSELK